MFFADVDDMTSIPHVGSNHHFYVVPEVEKHRGRTVEIM